VNVRCYRHPEREALFECATCGRLICERCMIHEGDEVRCPACSVGTAGRIAADEDHRRTRDVARRRAAAREERRVRERPLLHPGLFFLFVALAMGALALSWYLGRALPPEDLGTARAASVPDPAPEMVVVGAAVLAYRADHGRFPESLAVLVPGYLDRRPRVLSGDVDYEYRTEGDGFILSCPQANKYGYPRLDMTADGILRTEGAP
jgi:hypothetical protein